LILHGYLMFVEYKLNYFAISVQINHFVQFTVAHFTCFVTRSAVSMACDSVLWIWRHGNFSRCSYCSIFCL